MLIFINYQNFNFLLHHSNSQIFILGVTRDSGRKSQNGSRRPSQSLLFVPHNKGFPLPPLTRSLHKVK